MLSGGGSKGAYGAGAAKAILAYRALKGITNPLIYIGASAGALNAYLLASGSPDAAIGFWKRATNKTVLAKTWGGHRVHGLMRWATSFMRKGQPYSVYPNTALAKLIKNNVSVASLHSPLVIAATDYSEGVLKAFYASDLFPIWSRMITLALKGSTGFSTSGVSMTMICCGRRCLRRPPYRSSFPRPGSRSRATARPRKVCSWMEALEITRPRARQPICCATITPTC